MDWIFDIQYFKISIRAFQPYSGNDEHLAKIRKAHHKFQLDTKKCKYAVTTENKKKLNRQQHFMAYTRSYVYGRSYVFAFARIVDTRNYSRLFFKNTYDTGILNDVCVCDVKKDYHQSNKFCLYIFWSVIKIPFKLLF